MAPSGRAHSDVAKAARKGWACTPPPQAVWQRRNFAPLSHCKRACLAGACAAHTQVSVGCESDLAVRTSGGVTALPRTELTICGGGLPRGLEVNGGSFFFFF